MGAESRGKIEAESRGNQNIRPTLDEVKKYAEDGKYRIFPVSCEMLSDFITPMEALRILNDKIRDREIDKYYLCAVQGRPKPASGRLEDYLFKDAVKNQVYVKQKSEPGAKTAVTEYRVLCSSGKLSLVECHLLTGRTHQIRAQMSHAGWPLLGDGKYGSERFNKGYDEKGQALYSYRLVFDFPTDAGILNYLKGCEFRVDKVDFVEKYFPDYTIK